MPVIDDSKFLRRANELSLVKAVIRYSALQTARKLRLAWKKIPDVIVLDMMLPKMAGPQVLQSLKKDPRTSAIPVIVLSSLPQTNAVKLKQQARRLIWRNPSSTSIFPRMPWRQQSATS